MDRRISVLRLTTLTFVWNGNHRRTLLTTSWQCAYENSYLWMLAKTLWYTYAHGTDLLQLRADICWQFACQLLAICYMGKCGYCTRPTTNQTSCVSCKSWKLVWFQVLNLPKVSVQGFSFSFFFTRLLCYFILHIPRVTLVGSYR